MLIFLSKTYKFRNSINIYSLENFIIQILRSIQKRNSAISKTKTTQNIWKKMKKMSVWKKDYINIPNAKQINKTA